MKLSLILFFICTFFSIIHAEENIQDNSTQETFPREITVDYQGKKYYLDATGVATRKKMFFKVYSIAHYLENNVKPSKKDRIKTIMSDDYAKQLTMKWVRDVDNHKMKEIFLESFQNSLTPEKYAQLQKEINTYINIFNQDIHKGNEFILRWIPGGHVQVIVNGAQVGEINNKDFAVALWNIWFGDKSVVDRNELISLMK